MKRTYLAIGTILAVTCASAFAGDNGFYVGADAGRSSLNSTGVLANSMDTTFGITGGYQLNKNWGAEAGYTVLGNFAGVGRTTGSNYSSKIDAWSLVAVGKYPFSDLFSLYAKLGMASANNKQSSTTSGNRSTARTDATYGLGLQYDVNPAIGVRFGWDRFRSDSYVATTGVTNTNNADIWALGVVYKF